jgi:hypothetical protein
MYLVIILAAYWLNFCFLYTFTTGEIAAIYCTCICNVGIRSKEVKTNQISPTKNGFAFFKCYYFTILLRCYRIKSENKIHDCRMKQDKGEDNIDVSLDTKSQGTAVSNTTRRLREAKPVFAPGKNPPSGQTGFCAAGKNPPSGQTGFCARREPVSFIYQIITQCVQYIQ